MHYLIMILLDESHLRLLCVNIGINIVLLGRSHICAATPIVLQHFKSRNFRYTVSKCSQTPTCPRLPSPAPAASGARAAARCPRGATGTVGQAAAPLDVAIPYPEQPFLHTLYVRINIRPLCTNGLLRPFEMPFFMNFLI